MFVAVGGSATITTGNTLNQYEVGLFTKDGTRMTEALADTNTSFYVGVGGANSKLAFKSDLLSFANVTRISHRAYSAATQQSDYIGYNGSSSSIEVINNNLYMVDVYVEDYLTSSHDGRYIKHFQYKSDSTATQAEIAIGLAGSAVANWSREAKNASGDPFMKFKAVCNTALDTNNEIDNTLTVTKGSKVVNIATAANYNGGTAIAVGDFIRISDTDVTVALTDAVYKVVEINSLALTLDRPYQGTTHTAAHGDTNTYGNQVITAAQGAAADWGVFMEGQAKDHTIGKEFYGIVRYNFSLSGFGSTTTTSNATAAEGYGVENQMKDLEWFAYGNQGESYRMGEPAVHNFSSLVDVQSVADGYDVVTIEYESSDVVGFTANVGKKQLYILIPELTSGSTAPNYALNATTDDITDCLEQLLAGVPAYTEANSFDGTALTTADLAMG
jgi:hypothetical protein